MIFVWLVALLSCDGSKQVDADAIISVKGRVLTRSEVSAFIPKDVSYADSLLFAENYVKQWAKDILVYDVASRNLGDEKTEVERLVDNYRHSLIRYRYQDRLVEERLKENISESDKHQYYEQNKKLFILRNGLIKGLFLKIPVDAPGLSEIKRWYKSTDVASLEKIEKYSVQNAAIYEYFYDKWVDFDKVIDNIPVQVANPNNFIKTNKHLEVVDSLYCYLLNIKEYLPSGSVEPYEYASSRITEMLVNLRRVEFLRKFEDELYDDAVKSGDVVILSEP